MGTRHLVAVVIDRQYVVAQYGQWDGYPDCAGVTILEFLKGCDFEHLKEQLKKCRYITGEEIVEGYKKAGVPEDAEYITMEQACKFNQIYPYLSRDIGYNILKEISESPCDEIILKNSIDFAEDSLFCEWAYVVDFDKNKLEVYMGYNKERLTADERFYKSQFPNKGGYYPIKFIKKWDLNDLPEESEFLYCLNKAEDEEAEADLQEAIKQEP